MASIDEICEAMVNDTRDAVAANVIDLSSGMMLGGFFRSNFTTDHFEAVSAAATSLYRGKETLRVEKLVKEQRGLEDNGEHFVEEVQLTTSQHFHFLKKIPGRESVLCLVTKTSCSLGTGWACLKTNLDRFLPLLPG